MSLIVKGFGKQDIVSIEAVVDAVKRIPPHHIKGLTTLVYDPGRFFQRSYAAPRPINYRAAGQYDSAPIEHVLIYKFSSKQEFVHILYHEIGHHVFRKCLDTVQRKHWVTTLYPNSRYISEYAKTNANEDFAETYAFYMHSPHKLSEIRQKLAFIRAI